MYVVHASHYFIHRLLSVIFVPGVRMKILITIVVVNYQCGLMKIALWDRATKV
jgi:hypothetical protein